MFRVWVTAALLLGLAWAGPAKQVLLLDVSGSMVGREDGNTLVWPFAQRQLLRFAERVPAGEVEVIRFGDGVLGGPTFQFPQDRAKFRRYVRGLTMNRQGSAIFRAVASVYAKRCNSGTGIYLFTDGLDNRSDRVSLPSPGGCSLFLVTSGRALPAGFAGRLAALGARAVASVDQLPRPQAGRPDPAASPPPEAAVKAAPVPAKSADSAVKSKPAAAPAQPTPEPLAARPAPKKAKPAQTDQKAPQALGQPLPTPKPEGRQGAVRPPFAAPVAARGEQAQNPENLPPPTRLEPIPQQAVSFSLWPSVILTGLLVPLLVWRFRQRRGRNQGPPPRAAFPAASFSETLALAPALRSESRIELLLPQEKPMLVYPSETEPVDLGQHLRLPSLAGLTVRLTGDGMFVCQLPQQAKARLRTKGVGAGDLVGYGEILALETNGGQSLGWIRAANRRLSLKA